MGASLPLTAPVHVSHRHENPEVSVGRARSPHRRAFPRRLRAAKQNARQMIFGFWFRMQAQITRVAFSYVSLVPFHLSQLLSLLHFVLGLIHFETQACWLGHAPFVLRLGYSFVQNATEGTLCPQRLL